MVISSLFERQAIYYLFRILQPYANADLIVTTSIIYNLYPVLLGRKNMMLGDCVCIRKIKRSHIADDTSSLGRHDLRLYVYVCSRLTAMAYKSLENIWRIPLMLTRPSFQLYHIVLFLMFFYLATLVEKM